MRRNWGSVKVSSQKSRVEELLLHSKFFSAWRPNLARVSIGLLEATVVSDPLQTDHRFASGWTGPCHPGPHQRSHGDGPGEFRHPGQVAVSGGELFVIDVGNSRIQILDTAGHFRRAISLPYADNRTGLAVDDRGNIYVSNPELNQIQVFGHEGKRLYTFDPTTIEGANFSHPLGMWVDAGNCLYVVDSQSNRVGLFQISGQNAQPCR